MKFIFYFWGIMNLVFYTMPFILNTNKWSRKLLNLNNWWKQKKSKDMDFSDIPEGIQNNIYFVVIGSLSLLFWLVIGIFTFNWIIFLAFLIFILIAGKLATFIATHNYKRAYIIYLFVFNIIEAAMILFVTINAYHLKIDVWQYILTLI